jgi:hypothetical protein
MQVRSNCIVIKIFIIYFLILIVQENYCGVQVMSLKRIAYYIISVRN